VVILEGVSGRSESLFGLSFNFPIQPYSHLEKLKVGFWVILYRGQRLLLRCPYYKPLFWFMIIMSSDQYTSALYIEMKCLQVKVISNAHYSDRLSSS